MDASVLIDYIKAERSILKLIKKHIGPIYAVTPAAEEVKDVKNISELTRLGVTIIEPNIYDAFSATKMIGSTSYQDNLTMLAAKRWGYICVTNDKPLRNLCEKNNVKIYWGLELLIKVNQSGGISKEEAIQIANAIHQNNPKHISKKILFEFTNKIKKLR